MNYFVVFVIIATEMNFLKSFIPCYITTEFFSTIFKINNSRRIFPRHLSPKIFLLFTEMLIITFLIPSTVFFIILFSHCLMVSILRKSYQHFLNVKKLNRLNLFVKLSRKP